jgi:hypothetical protein
MPTPSPKSRERGFCLEVYNTAMAFQKAQSLNTALPLLNHLQEEFGEEELDKVYVDREEVRKQLGMMIQALERDYPGRFLLTGHKGVGKSIALHCSASI